MTNKKLQIEDAIDPLNLFISWMREHAQNTKSKHPYSCVLSTIGLDGFPNARTLVLKKVRDSCLVITGSTNSRKGLEISSNSKVALTFWWEESRRQIRFQGIASRIAEEDADFYFSKRNKESQAVSAISEQGKPLQSRELLEYNINMLLESYAETNIPRPGHWLGYKIEPVRVEFMEFEQSRNHHRVLFSRTASGWKSSMLQP